MQIDQSKIEEAVAQEVADRLVGDDDLYSRVQRAVDARINELFKQAADAQIKAAIDAAIAKGFEQEYCRVNSFGQREGTPTTIRAELEKQIGGYWNTKVDKQGKPSSGYGAELTRAEWMMTQLVAADFSGEMKQHVINLGGSFKDKLRSELHETVNKLLSEVFHVNSADDQKSKRSGRSSIDPAQNGPA